MRKDHVAQFTKVAWKSTHGCVYINDVDITQLSMEERSSFRRWHIGFIFQNFNLIPEMNVFENNSFTCQTYGKKISVKKEVNADS